MGLVFEPVKGKAGESKSRDTNRYNLGKCLKQIQPVREMLTNKQSDTTWENVHKYKQIQTETTATAKNTLFNIIQIALNRY